MKVVVLVSANAEWKVVKDIYPGLQLETSPFGEFAEADFEGQPVTLVHGGWGKISAAASAQYAIDRFKPDLLINLGTCGGFEGAVERGTIILVEKTIVYDILEQMSDPEEAIRDYSTKIDLSFLPRILPSPVLRGLLVSADRDIVREDISVLIKKYQAFAADWESGAIAWVAKRNDVRCLILRGVTDLVNPQSGEAYGNFDLFEQRTREVMRKLFELLPKWRDAVQKVEQGYRGY